MQRVLYGLFLASCIPATVMMLLVVWAAVDPGRSYYQCLGTCAVVMVASAFTMSATRLVRGRAPEDDRG